MMFKASALLLLISIISQGAAFHPAARHHPSRSTFRLHSTPEQIAELKKDFSGDGSAAKAILLDVRELEPFTAGHLNNATPAPLSVLLSGQWMDSSTGIFSPGSFPIDRLTGVAIVSKARIYLTHDVDKQAEDMLAKMGYSNVVVLSESYEEIASLHGVSEVVQGGLNELTDG